jgi:hypothetical protein
MVLALAGVIAGAVGGGLLGSITACLISVRERLWPLAVGAALGLLVPVAVEWDAFGIFVFYILWQGGYAAALAPVVSPAKRQRASRSAA